MSASELEPSRRHVRFRISNALIMGAAPMAHTEGRQRGEPWAAHFLANRPRHHSVALATACGLSLDCAITSCENVPLLRMTRR